MHGEARGLGMTVAAEREIVVEQVDAKKFIAGEEIIWMH